MDALAESSFWLKGAAIEHLIINHVVLVDVFFLKNASLCFQVSEIGEYPFSLRATEFLTLERKR